ncbi:hypothetical protein H5V45_03425 [Nocardioides sp. KIGAM211]|uniref:ATP-grasp domain-containing protein n=1 Tax=Nocardioides luti TaxID=2761101 RepID=A0A7X0RDS5_9ACTN|nr:hypothetical protein [Nocardioides luti]MBB6626365.1 hypothetical protein [Nocardioides luti]
MDLTDPDQRAAVTARLAGLYAGQPVVVGPTVLAGTTSYVAWFRARGCPVLVLATARGAGAVPVDGDCVVVDVTPPPTVSVTEELRTHDRLARHLPAEVVAAVEAFDPERRGTWFTTPFVTTDEPILGRPATGGRPASFLALEDKMLADEVWDAAGVRRAPYLIAPVDDAALARATDELAGPLGAVWSGDARDGFNGGGNFVRWIREDADQAAAMAFFAPRCDRVRVLPFLDGVPCSIHGFVLPDGTAALRPVEIAMLRDVEHRSFVYGGLGTFWDPPEADRAAMRDVVRRVGAHLQAAHGYRGAFGVDGVLTADGFLPTELNTRMSAGATTVAEVDREFFTLLQANLVAGVDTGLTVADVEALAPLMDAERHGKVVAFADERSVGGPDAYDVAWDGRAFARADAPTGNVLSVADTPSGMFAKVDPCSVLTRGGRLAEVNLALMAFLDREYAVGFGDLTAAPDLR